MSIISWQAICHEFLCLAEPRYWLLLFCGAGALLFKTPESSPPFWYLSLSALAEECIFRFWLQEFFRSLSWGKKNIGPFTRANVFVSCLFALTHLTSHSPLWAAGIFLPSLAFGWSWDRFQRIFPCWFLHLVYNALYFRTFF